MRNRFPLILFFAFVFASVLHAMPRQASQDSRAAAEPLIRAAVYESTLATLTGDAKLYRARMAGRTVELYRLIFEGFREVPDYAAMLSENKLDTADKFMETTFKQGATQWANLSKDEMEQRARAQSNGKLTFFSDQEATVESGVTTYHVVYEDKTWKIDETEAAKKLFLDNFQFTPATRAKIEKL
ncbi:MAG TPA: hypothetical protein VGQ72_03095 [Pyrinomonadaceae bacterium]|jgi:hypothetical protein|nr:hypothetical protein [Pyrinomonadaceae bacterium]